MIKANFSAYSKYVTDSLNQWDLNQVLQVTGLNLTTAPEVHFSNANTDRAIVRQSTMTNHVVSVAIPNSLLQDPLRIYAHIGIYEGETFKVVELVEIPVNARKRPLDYQIEANDEEVYSFKRLENLLEDKATKAQVANIVAGMGSDAELVDVRYGADGVTYASAGEAVRAVGGNVARIQNGDKYCKVTEINQHYHKLARAVYTRSRYRISVTSDTTFVCSDIQMGTESAASSMIDTIANSVQLTANVPASFYYEPSEDSLSVLCVRNPNGYGITVEVCRVVNAADIYGVNDAVNFVIPQVFGAVGDGVTDDTAAFNAAIEYAYANGIKNVVIPKSDDCYRIKCIELKDGVNLIGNGGVLKVVDNYAISANTSYHVILANANNVRLENLVIYGNSEHNTSFTVCDTITVLGDNVTVKNCQLYDAIDSAIMFSRCTHSFCVGNYIDGARDLGIYINDGDDGKACVDNVISQNIIDNCANGGIALKRNCQRNLVAENVISNTSEAGASGIALVRADTDTDFSYNNSIVNNRIYCADNGIYMENTDHNVVTGNRVEFYREKGIVITGVCCENNISNNVISQRTDAVLPTSDYNGGIIFLNNSGGETMKNIIADNVVETLHNPALSCYTTHADDTVIDKNVITGNVFTSVNSYAIYAFDALQGNVVNGNVFDSNRASYIDGDNIAANNIGL